MLVFLGKMRISAKFRVPLGGDATDLDATPGPHGMMKPEDHKHAATWQLTNNPITR